MLGSGDYKFGFMIVLELLQSCLGVWVGRNGQVTRGDVVRRDGAAKKFLALVFWLYF